MTIDRALGEWYSKKRRRGCVSAARWFCVRVPGFVPYRITRYNKLGQVYCHTVAYNGNVVIDLVPNLDNPRDP